MPRREARDLVDAYSNWQLVQIDVPLILAASQLEERHTLSFWDALIVEAAARAAPAGSSRKISKPAGTFAASPSKTPSARPAGPVSR